VFQGVLALHLTLWRLPGLARRVITRALHNEETLRIKVSAFLVNEACCTQENTPALSRVLNIEVALFRIKGKMFFPPY
jgi:hypothetical protein